MKQFVQFILPVILCLAMPAQSFAAFGLSTATNSYTVDTGAGLVFKIRRTDNGSSTQSPGDIMSLVYNGVEYQDQSRGSHINSGFDWLGYDTSSVNVTAEEIGSDTIKITVTTDHLIHYYIARNGYPHIYMATWFDVQPVTGGGLCRYIVRMPSDNLPNGPEPSDIYGTTTTVESGDIFGFDNGITRSKHYSNHRLIDWAYTGATGNGVGVFMIRDSQEGGSGGPFYRSLINQRGSDQEITYIINYGQAQTEAFRTSILNGLYTLVFTDGHQPDPNIDTSWVDSAGLNLIDWVPASGRGYVAGTASGIPDGFETVIGFANTNAQYWALAADDGTYITPAMIPGTYNVTLYKQELEVATDTVTVTAGNTSTLDIASAQSNPAVIWRLGDRDGTPNGFMNADRATWMHPSDVRMDDWNLGTFVVGSDTPATGIPCYQWKGISGGGQDIQFDLTAGQIVNTTVKVGMTVAYANGRPNIKVNGWTAGLQSASSQPSTRSLTTGSYRGNNTEYTFTVPASALNVGTNTLRVYPISGSGYPTGFLSAGYSLDYIEWRGTPATLPAAPAGLSANTGNTRIDLAWEPVASALHYIVQCAPTADGPYTTLSANVGAAHYSDTAATNDITWHYRISAVNAIGEGDYSEIAATPSHLVTHLKFDETSGSTATDTAGSHDGTLMAGASWTSGQINNAIQLDGTSDGYVELPDGLVEELTDCTIATWVNASSTLTWSRIFDFGMGTESYMFLTPNSGSGVHFGITLASGGGEQSLNDSSTLPLYGWHHVAVTLSGDTGKLYIDGSLTDTQTITLDPADLGLTRHDYIGKSQWSDPYPTAKIDDFRIYDYALSTNEVASLTLPPSFVSDAIDNLDGIELEPYAGASLADYIDTSQDTLGLTFSKESGPDWLTVAQDGTLSGTPMNSDVGPNAFTVRVTDGQGFYDTSQMTIQVANIYSGTQGMEDLVGLVAQWLTLDCGFCNGADLNGDHDVTLADFSMQARKWLLSENLRLLLKFDEMTGTIANDSSLYGRPGQLVNGPIWDSGHVGGALSFDGVDDYVEVPGYKGITGGASRTCTAWIKAPDSSDEILSWGDLEYGGKWIIRINETGTLRAEVQGGYIYGSTVINDDAWHHIAVVLDSDGTPDISEVLLYVDGQLETPAAVSAHSIDTSATQDVSIGVHYSSSRYFRGLIDEVRIYDRALSQEEITGIVE